MEAMPQPRRPANQQPAQNGRGPDAIPGAASGNGVRCHACNRRAACLGIIASLTYLCIREPANIWHRIASVTTFTLSILALIWNFIPWCGKRACITGRVHHSTDFVTSFHSSRAESLAGMRGILHTLNKAEPNAGLNEAHS